MRTKTLLLTAALGAAGVASSMAQVYSVNTVGYVNVTVPPKFSLIANPLNAADNTVKALIASAPDDTTIYKFNGTAYDINTFSFGEWSVPTMKLDPGEGAFINNPTTAAITITFVGDVLQGTGANALKTDIPKGFSIRSSKVPQKGQLDTDLKFPAVDDDVVYRFDPATQAYKISTFSFGSWDSAPIIEVGESFFVNKAAQATWTREFSTN